MSAARRNIVEMGRTSAITPARRLPKKEPIPQNVERYDIATVLFSGETVLARNDHSVTARVPQHAPKKINDIVMDIMSFT